MKETPAKEEKMGRDILLKRYLSDNERYADLMNGTQFGGKQIVQAKDFEELDSQTGVENVQKEARRQGKSRKPRYRDLIRKVAFGVNFAVIGLENQDEVNYLMPLRVMSYDVDEYEKQAAAIGKEVKKKKGIRKSEFLSGFLKDSKLHPCITLVLYYGEQWDGNKELHGMIDFTNIPKELKNMVNNYSINLLEIRKFTNTELFKTDLKQVFDFIRCSSDKKKLRELVEKDDVYKEMDEEAYDVAVAFTKANELAGVKKYHGKEGKIDMCKALTELIEEGRKEGLEEGRTESIRNIKQLYSFVMRDNRMEDFTKAMENSDFLQMLYAEYGIG